MQNFQWKRHSYQNNSTERQKRPLGFDQYIRAGSSYIPNFDEGVPKELLVTDRKYKFDFYFSLGVVPENPVVKTIKTLQLKIVVLIKSLIW